MNDVHKLGREQMAELIRVSDLAGAGWHAPVYREAMEGNLNFVLNPPGAKIPSRLLDVSRQRKPLIIIIGGDGFNAVGPEGFPQSRRLLRWASYIVLHGTGGEAWHYALAVEAAVRFERVLIAECVGADLPAWIALKKRVAPATQGVVWQTPPGARPHMGEIRPAPEGTVLQ